MYAAAFFGEAHLEEEPIGRALLRCALPVLVSQLVQQLYIVADCAVIGRFGGPYGLAAVNVASLVISVAVNFFIGFSVGVSTVTSQLFGARKYERLKMAVFTASVISAGAGVGLSLLLAALGGQIFAALGVPTEVMPDALVFLRLTAAGMTPLIFFNAGSAILRALGCSVPPLIYLAASSALNVCLDLLFAVRFGWGLAGAAAATAVSQWTLGGAMLWRLSRLDPRWRLSPASSLLPPCCIARMMRLSVPSGMQAVFMSASSLLIQTSINSFGPEAMAGMTVYSRVEGFLYYPAFAFGIAITAFVGQNYGARRPDRVRESVALCVRRGAAITGAACAAAILAARPIVSCFTSDEAAIANGMSAIVWNLPFYFLYTINQVYIGGLKGLGRTVWPMICAMVSYCVFRVVWVKCVLLIWHDMRVVYLAYDLSWIIMLAMLLADWKKTAARAL